MSDEVFKALQGVAVVISILSGGCVLVEYAVRVTKWLLALKERKTKRRRKRQKKRGR